MSAARRFPMALIAVLLLSACGAGDKDAEQAETPTVDETAFGDMVGTIDKAEGVQDTVHSQKQETDRLLDEAEGTH